MRCAQPHPGATHGSVPAVRVVALAGGVGAAKFLRGLAAVMPPENLTIIGNTGDDAIFHGLHVSPDLDIVTYTLGGIVDPDKGWGVAGDTRRALDQLGRLGIDTWFWLGDTDLGTHIARTMWLREGVPLSEVTDRIRTGFGVGARILPMSDEAVRTKLVTVAGKKLDFQDYFVRRGHTDAITAVEYEGATKAHPAPGVLEAIINAHRIIVCPSNPVLSIGPILAVPQIRKLLAYNRKRVFAISPIVQGAALRGPADRLLPVVKVDPNAVGVAMLYAGFCGTFLADRRDSELGDAIKVLGMRPVFMETIMDTPEVAEALATKILSMKLA